MSLSLSVVEVVSGRRGGFPFGGVGRVGGRWCVGGVGVGLEHREVRLALPCLGLW